MLAYPRTNRADFQPKQSCRLGDGKQIVLRHGGPRVCGHVSRLHERRDMLRCRLCGSALTCLASRTAVLDVPGGRGASTGCQAHMFPEPAARSKSLPSWFNLRGAQWRFCSLHKMRSVLYLYVYNMRRALKQPRLTEAKVSDGQIWGDPSESTYDPFDLYERGVAPHLAFANAKDPLQWHKDYGPLFGFTEFYSRAVEDFWRAQRKFVAVLNLWQAWNKDRKDLSECFMRAVTETGIVHLPGQITMTGLNQDWEFEAPDAPSFMREQIGKSKPNRSRLVVDGREQDPYAAAVEFAGSASHKDLRQAAEELLKYALATRLEGIQPDFLNQEGFEPTWTVRDLLQACYLMLFFDMTKRKAIRDCKACGQFFYPTSKRPRFCSKDCARKSRQRRYWKKRGKLLRRKRREV